MLPDGELRAVKQINKRKIQNTKHAKYVEREIKALQKINSPFVVHLYDVAEDSFFTSLQIELGEHGDLKALLMKGESCTEFKRIVCAQIVEALAATHKVGIIHRDIKPENIVLDRNYCAKLCDFGTARFTEESLDSKPSFVGSPPFMAPEIVEGKAVLFESDLFSLGCTIHEIFTGSSPFVAQAPMISFEMITSNRPNIDDSLENSLRDLIQKLISHDPKQRLGAGEHLSGYPSIKSHPFFDGIDWDSIATSDLSSLIQHDLTSSNFQN